MKRRYLNQGSSGPNFSSLAVKDSYTGSAQGVHFEVRSGGEGGFPRVESVSVILDAEQVADLRDFLLKICPCASNPKVSKIVDE